jgi:hypothetical protein
LAGAHVAAPGKLGPNMTSGPPFRGDAEPVSTFPAMATEHPKTTTPHLEMAGRVDVPRT